MHSTISKKITNGTGKHTLKCRLKAAAGKKVSKHTVSSGYRVENDPMIPLLKAAGFREMTDAEYKKVQPYLMPKKAK